MKIEKENIVKAFMIFENSYLEFSKRIEDKEKVKKMINVWSEIFDAIDFDYEYANEDFLKAVRKAIINNKYIPTIAEISEEMKKLYVERNRKDKRQRICNILEIESQCNLKSLDIQKTADIYSKINKKYNDNELIALIKRYRDIENVDENMILNTEDMFEKIMEE